MTLAAGAGPSRAVIRAALPSRRRWLADSLALLTRVPLRRAVARFCSLPVRSFKHVRVKATPTRGPSTHVLEALASMEAPALPPPPVDGALPDGTGSGGTAPSVLQVRFSLAPRARRAACHEAAAKRRCALVSAARGPSQPPMGFPLASLAFFAGPLKRV